MKLVVLLALALLVRCGDPEPPKQRIVFENRPGRLEVPGGEIWYRVATGGPGTPVILLHGGPGATSHYLEPVSSLKVHRTVVLYDQLGSGRSDRIRDTTLMTIDRYVEELEALREHLGIERFHLYGHSWGTILAVEYYLRHPDDVASLILAGPALSIPRWIADADSLVGTLPDSTREAIARAERRGTFDSPEYQAATMEFYRRYLVRRQPWSDNVDSTFAGTGTEVYGYMWGPSEFTARGTLRDYDITARLGEIRVPTLFIVGEHDEVSLATARHFQSLVPGAELEVIPGAGHLMMQDEPGPHQRVVEAFLQQVEQGSR